MIRVGIVCLVVLVCCDVLIGSSAMGESVLLDEITIRGEQQQPIQEQLTIREVGKARRGILARHYKTFPGCRVSERAQLPTILFCVACRETT